MTSTRQQSPLLYVGSTKDDVSTILNETIIQIATQAIKQKNKFIIALSGGSLPQLLSSLSSIYENPQWDKWFIILADERCVSIKSDDSNMKSIKEHFLKTTSIPSNQILSISEELVADGIAEQDINTSLIAQDYQTRILQLFGEGDQQQSMVIDLAVLGFGPDGHTCSLFPDHPLLKEKELWVAPIDDSPKPPPKRITLTLPVLNKNTNHVIFCGTGDSKQPIIQQVFEEEKEKIESSENNGITKYKVKMVEPPPYPCAMVRPVQSLIWIIDTDAIGNGDDENQSCKFCFC